MPARHIPLTHARLTVVGWGQTARDRRRASDLRVHLGVRGELFLKLVLGILYGIAGVVLVVFPAAGVVSLTGVLGVMLIAEGIVEIFIAFGAPALAGRSWLVFSAISSLLLGVMILAQWPNSSAWAIGTPVGVAVLINGITRMVISTAVHHEARAMTPIAA